MKMVRSARPSPFRISAVSVEDRRWNRGGTGRVDSTRKKVVREREREGGEEEKEESKAKNAVDTGGRPTDYFQGCIGNDGCIWRNLSGWLALRLHRSKASSEHRWPLATGRRARRMKETANSSSSGSSSPLIRSRNYRPRDERIARKPLAHDRRDNEAVLHASPGWNAS